MQPIQIMMHSRPIIEPQQKGSFQSGQILLGKMTKLYPDNIASVQIGSQIVTAALDVPLKVGESYWLQVQPGEGQVRLKLLETISANDRTRNKVAEQVLAHLSLGKSKEATSIADFFLKNQLPITKETMESSLQFLKDSSTSSQGLNIIKTMLVQELPMVKDVFAALQSVENGKPFHTMLSSLLQSLSNSEKNTYASKQTKALLETLVLPKQELMASTGMQKIFSLWLKVKTPATIREGAYAIMQNAGLIANNVPESETLSALLDKIIPLERDSVVTVVKGGLTNLANQGLIEPTETNDIIGELNRLLRNSGERQSQDVTSLAKTLLEAVHANFEAKAFNGTSQEQNPVIKLLNNNPDTVQMAGREIGNLLVKAAHEQTADKGMEAQAVTLKYVLENDFKIIDFENSGNLSSNLKNIVSKMGLGFEHVLATENHVTDDQSETLKPLLMKMLHEDLPMMVKDLAEQTIQRITAQQILAQENGPLQQLLLQIPLTMGSHQTDLTMQWTGRRKKDGTIDPAYCRILFYLELESLKETVIDMGVQNRVIKVSIIHEHPERFKQLATPFIALMKKNLEEMDYKLSSIVFENTAEKTQIKKTSQACKMNDTYSGLDLRI